MNRETDNRDMDEMRAWYEARTEALKKRIQELEQKNRDLEREISERIRQLLNGEQP